MSGPPSESGSDPGPPKLSREMVGYFWRFLSADRKKLIGSCLLITLLGSLPAIMGLVPTLLTSNWTPERITVLWWGLAGLLLLTLLFNALQYALTWMTSEVSQNFVKRVRVAIFRKIGNLPSLAMNSQSVGSLAYRSTSDVFRIQMLITPLAQMALGQAAQLLFAVAALFWLGPWFAAIGLVLIPLLWMAVAKLNRRVERFARAGQQQSEVIMTRFIEGVSGYRDLVAAGRFEHAVDAFESHSDEFRRTQIKTSLLNYWVSSVPLLAFSLLIFAFYFIKTSNLEAVGNMEYIGKVISFASLIGMVQGPVIGLTKFSTDVALTGPSMVEVHRLLTAPEVGDIASGGFPSSSGIELDQVTFRYRPDGPPTLDAVSCNIEPGSFTAIVGQTGTGKSTLFYLMLRLLEPMSGEIRVGGVRLRDMPLSVLRDFIGFIPQAPFIFDSTIRENLCMGVPSDRFEPARMAQAISLARLDGLIAARSTAGGMEASVGPGGATLSGGERQRIALGRIFLRNPEIIVCDEYTANIDNATARLIHDALANAFAGKTRIVITHQLYTVRGADRILVLDRGKIVDAGTHEELLARGGLYREMWEVQRLS